MNTNIKSCGTQTDSHWLPRVIRVVTGVPVAKVIYTLIFEPIERATDDEAGQLAMLDALDPTRGLMQ